MDYVEVMGRARAILGGMIHSRDAAGIAAMRSVISALENACAVPEESGESDASEFIAGARSFREAEALRRSLSDEEIDQILADEVSMRLEQADALTKAKRDLESSMARYQATVVTRLREGDLP